MRLRHLVTAGLVALAAFGVQLPFSPSAGAATETLGATTAGPLTDSYDANHMNGSRFVTGASGGTVSSMSVFVGAVGTAPNNSYQMAIYSDASGVPSARLAQTATGALVANSFNTLPITATLAPNTPYWLMYNTNGSNPNLNNMLYATGGTGGWSSASVAFGTWPATFGPSSIASFTFSLYATYTTGADPAPTVTMSAPANNATVSGTTVTVSANATNAVGVQFRLGNTNIGAEDTAAPYSIAWDSTTVANGSYALSAVARNASGQAVAAAPVNVTVQNVTTPPPPPTVALTAPAPGATLSGVQTLSANATNAVGVTFKVDGVAVGAEDTAAPFTAAWDSASVANGTHLVSADARSASGAVATASVSVTVNNVVTPPPPPPRLRRRRPNPCCW